MSLFLVEAKLPHPLLTGHMFQPQPSQYPAAIIQCFGKSKPDTVLQHLMCQTQGSNHFSWPADYTLAIKAQYMTDCLPGSPDPFLQSCFLPNQLAWMLYMIILEDVSLHLPLLKLRFLAAHLSNLSSSLWIADLPFKISTTDLVVCSLLRAHSVSSSMLLIRT